MTPPYIPMEGFGMQGLRLPKWLVNPETDDEYAQRFPGTFGDPLGVPNGSVMGPNGLMVPPDLPPRLTPQDVGVSSMGNPNWAARLFGGSDPLAGGTLQAPQANSLGRDALRQMGISLLQNSGPNPYRRGLGELLGTALGAGQQAYQQGATSALQRQGQVQQQQMLQRRQQIAQRYQGRTDPASLASLLQELIAVGDVEAARPLSEYLKSQRETQVRPVAVQTVDAQGRPVTRYVVPREGEEYARPTTEDGVHLPGYLTPEGRNARVDLERRLAALGGRSAGERTRVQGIQELIALADDITEPGGLLAQTPGGVGLMRKAPDFVNQRLDPSGIPLRSTISNLKTTIRQLRSGAAVTESEAVQLEGMLPDRSDSPEAVRRKVQTLRVHLERLLTRAGGSTDELEAAEGGDGYPE